MASSFGFTNNSLKLVDLEAVRARIGTAIIDELRAGSKFKLPIVDFSVEIPNPDEGLIVYDEDSQETYVGNGTNWVSLSSGGGSGSSVKSYSFIKSGDQTINTSVVPTTTLINNWTIAPSGAYHSIPDWDLSGGIYTATSNNTFLSLNVTLSWKGGVSNLGRRSLKIRWYDDSSSTVSIVKESVTQADPNAAVATTQEISFSLKLDAGDQVAIEVSHTAPVNLLIEGGVSTHISGMEII